MLIIGVSCREHRSETTMLSFMVEVVGSRVRHAFTLVPVGVRIAMVVVGGPAERIPWGCRNVGSY